MTLDRTGMSAAQVTHDEPDGPDEAGQFRPRRPNASPVSADPAPESTVQAGGDAQTATAPPDGSTEPAQPVRAPVRRWRDGLAVILAIATFLALVGAALWVGSGLASRDTAPAGGAGSRLPAGPSAGDGSGSTAASAPVTATPSTSVPVTSQPAAPAPSRTRTPPPANSVRATVTVVNDRGGAFQLALVVNNTSAVTQSWEVVITFPVRVTQLRAIGNGDLTARSDQAIVRGTSGPGESAVAIGGVTSDGSTLRTWTCTVNGRPC